MEFEGDAGSHCGSVRIQQSDGGGEFPDRRRGGKGSPQGSPRRRGENIRKFVRRRSATGTAVKAGMASEARKWMPKLGSLFGGSLFGNLASHALKFLGPAAVIGTAAYGANQGVAEEWEEKKMNSISRLTGGLVRSVFGGFDSIINSMIYSIPNAVFGTEWQSDMAGQFEKDWAGLHGKLKTAWDGLTSWMDDMFNKMVHYLNPFNWNWKFWEKWPMFGGEGYTSEKPEGFTPRGGKKETRVPTPAIPEEDPAALADREIGTRFSKTTIPVIPVQRMTPGPMENINPILQKRKDGRRADAVTDALMKQAQAQEEGNRIMERMLAQLSSIERTSGKHYNIAAEHA